MAQDIFGANGVFGVGQKKKASPSPTPVDDGYLNWASRYNTGDAFPQSRGRDRNKVSTGSPYDSPEVDAYLAARGQDAGDGPYGSPQVDAYLNRPKGSRQKRPRRNSAAPAMPAMKDFIPKPRMGAINEAKREAKGYYTSANKMLKAEIQAAKAEVKRQFKLSRTRQEKKALKLQLRDLENQEAAAQVAIDRAYGDAIVKINEAAKGNERMAGRVADRTFEFWDRAAKAQAGNTAATQASSEAGAALGVGGMSIGGDVTGETAFSSSRGAADAAKQLDLGRIAAAEQRALASSLAGQEAARQGELQRAALGMRNDAVAQSFADSNARIAQERAAQAAALQQLAMLGIQGRQDNMSSMAGVSMDAGMAKSQLGNDWANAVAQAAAADAQNAYEARMSAQSPEVTPQQFAARQDRFVAAHPSAAGIERMRQMNGPYRAPGYGVMPSSSRVIAAEVEGLIRSQFGLSQGERSALALEWLSAMEDRYGPNFLLYLDNVGGITPSQLGL